MVSSETQQRISDRQNLSRSVEVIDAEPAELNPDQDPRDAAIGIQPQREGAIDIGLDRRQFLFVNAGLAVIDAVAGLKKDIAVRVGIATGPVVVGDMIGEGASQEAAVTGETPNLAARLQEIAGPGTIVIAPSTHRLASNAFDCSRMQPRDLKGMAEPVRPWRVAGPRKVGTRFEAARGANLTDLVGREDEVDLLARRWEAAKSGEAQVVLLAGEASIGKSRITQTLRERIAGEPYTRITFQCSPFFINRASIGR